jgi:hypothetical protein
MSYGKYFIALKDGKLILRYKEFKRVNKHGKP